MKKTYKETGIRKSTLSTWGKMYEDNAGDVPTRCRGNFESDKAKEITKLRKDLRDTQDALDILKKEAYWENNRSSIP